MMQTQLAGTPSFRQDGATQWWLNRVILIGSDSVVSRALQTYLRNEGYLASVTSEELEGWSEASFGAAFDRRPRIDAQQSGEQNHDVHLVIIAPSVTGVRREALCRRLRSSAHLAHIPILALHDAGDAPKPTATPTVAIASGGAAGHYAHAPGDPPPFSSKPSQWDSTSFGAESAGFVPNASVNASLSWPFRLREVLSLVDQLLAEARMTSGRTAV
ncbi:MAG TPA: hypothetical protein VGW38_29505 [Chloroflexota bacterium]|nr:hypothetical protein [Chloroflexota bacterium]